MREATTTVRVKDGETLVISGLINDQDVKTVQKVPLLGDIPFFGQLFRNTAAAAHARPGDDLHQSVAFRRTRRKRLQLVPKEPILETR